MLVDKILIGDGNNFSITQRITKKPMSKYAQKTKPEGGNALKSYRESLLMSKAELARKARLSPITISRIEEGYPCRMDTKRKIILALGLNLSEKHKVFSD